MTYSGESELTYVKYLYKKPAIYQFAQNYLQNYTKQKNVAKVQMFPANCLVKTTKDYNSY